MLDLQECLKDVFALQVCTKVCPLDLIKCFVKCASGNDLIWRVKMFYVMYIRQVCFQVYVNQVEASVTPYVFAKEVQQVEGA